VPSVFHLPGRLGSELSFSVDFSERRSAAKILKLCKDQPGPAPEIYPLVRTNLDEFARKLEGTPADQRRAVVDNFQAAAADVIQHERRHRLGLYAGTEISNALLSNLMRMPIFEVAGVVNPTVTHTSPEEMADTGVLLRELSQTVLCGGFICDPIDRLKRIVDVVLQAPGHERLALARAVQKTCGEIFILSDYRKLADNIRKVPSRSWDALIALTEARSIRYPHAQVEHLVRILEDVDFEERGDLLELVQPLRRQSEGQICSALHLLINTEPDARQAHMDRLLAADPPPRWDDDPLASLWSPSRFQSLQTLENANLENVMNEGHIKGVAAVVQELRTLVGKKTLPVEKVVSELDALIEKLEAQRPEVPIGLYKEREGGGDGLQRARWVLHRPKDAQMTFLSDPIEKNAPYKLVGGEKIGVGELVALAWAAIDTHPSAHERELMREALVSALAGCIEDDGHRVCNDGITQRLVKFFHGRFGEQSKEVVKVTANTVMLGYGYLLKTELGDTVPTREFLREWANKAAADSKREAFVPGADAGPKEVARLRKEAVDFERQVLAYAEQHEATISPSLA
jgi:hypothetical protein